MSSNASTSNVFPGTLANLQGFGPLSHVINFNANYTKVNALSKDEAATRYAQKNPDGSLDLSGNFSTHGNLVVDKDLTVTGNVTANEITTTSDARVKRDLIPVRGALGKIMGLKGYSYTRKDWQQLNVPRDQRFIGLLAQEVEEVVPEAVNYEGDTGLLSVNYPSLAAVLLESIKELYSFQQERNNDQVAE